MRVADYIANFVYEQNVKDVFLVSGGGMMFLSDGIASHPKLNPICTHHEQAAAYAAVAYAKYTENIGVAYLTTGCGSTNGITGLLDAWQDNTPVLFISGQVKRKETQRNSPARLRQFGVQEADIIPIVSHLTKYAVMVNDPADIKYELEKAVYIAKSGRPGPVWIDVPLDVQSAKIDPANLKSFNINEIDPIKTSATSEEIMKIEALLNNATRPIIVAGQGIRIAKARDEFKTLIEKFNIPFVTSRLGLDILPTNHRLYIGRIGTKGDRAGNFAVANSDLIISLGSRLSVCSTGHEYELFGRKAKLVAIDIDPNEHKKGTVRVDLEINADAKEFLKQFNPNPQNSFDNWTSKCVHWKDIWPACLPEYYNDDSQGINLYTIIDSVSKQLSNDAAIVSDAGSSFYVTSQALMFNHSDQRYITSGGQADMGFGLPAAIGTAIAKNGEVIAMTGDGSLQMTIQELQTLKHYNLPVKLFVWNNDGYLSIRASQRKFFNERYIGTDKSSGVSFPDLEKIAAAYGIKYFKLSKVKELSPRITEIIATKGPVIVEVMCIRDQDVVPAISAKTLPDGKMVSSPIEDMYPFLDRDVLKREMLIEMYPEK